MWLNKERQTVAQWELMRGDSHCPLCERSLVPKRGDLVRWHWAHERNVSRHAPCPFEESAWHMAWKQVFLDGLGWEIEVPWRWGAHRFVLDAIRQDRDRVLEFVHSMSPYYLAKHAALMASGLNVNWLLDGAMWVSNRKKEMKDGAGFRKFLKARAFDVFQSIPTVWVHFDGAMWRHWRANVWYPADTEGTGTLLDLWDWFEFTRARYG